MENGYALCTAEGLQRLSSWLAAANPKNIDDLRGHLRIGLHRDVEVIDHVASTNHIVSQALCAALPVAYSRVPAPLWVDFATFVLEAAYEATLLGGLPQAHQGRSNVVMLTLLGGGAFGNAQDWIFSAIRRALPQVRDQDPDIRIVSYSSPSPDLCNFVEEANWYLSQRLVCVGRKNAIACRPNWLVRRICALRPLRTLVVATRYKAAPRPNFPPFMGADIHASSRCG